MALVEISCLMMFVLSFVDLTGNSNKVGVHIDNSVYRRYILLIQLLICFPQVVYNYTIIYTDIITVYYFMCQHNFI